LVSCRIVVFPSLEELEELLRSPFLEEAHKRTGERLHLSARHLGNPAIAVDETACDLLEFEIARNIGMDEDLGKLSRGDDELGDKIDGIVAIAAQFFGCLLSRPEFTPELGVGSMAPAHQGLGMLGCHKRTWVRLRLAPSPP
jgi:hypothetical protein